MTDMVEHAPTPAQLAFLIRVSEGLRLPHADRAQDRVRQSCRRHGWAEVLMEPRRWAVTEAGRRLIDTALNEKEGGE